MCSLPDGHQPGAAPAWLHTAASDLPYELKLTPAVCKAFWITWTRLNGVCCEDEELPVVAAEGVPVVELASCDW